MPSPEEIKAEIQRLSKLTHSEIVDSVLETSTKDPHARTIAIYKERSHQLKCLSDVNGLIATITNNFSGSVLAELNDPLIKLKSVYEKHYKRLTLGFDEALTADYQDYQVPQEVTHYSDASLLLGYSDHFYVPLELALSHALGKSMLSDIATADSASEPKRSLLRTIHDANREPFFDTEGNLMDPGGRQAYEGYAKRNPYIEGSTILMRADQIAASSSYLLKMPTDILSQMKEEPFVRYRTLPFRISDLVHSIDEIINAVEKDRLPVQELEEKVDAAKMATLDAKLQALKFHPETVSALKERALRLKGMQAYMIRTCQVLSESYDSKKVDAKAEATFLNIVSEAFSNNFLARHIENRALRSLLTQQDPSVHLKKGLRLEDIIKFNGLSESEKIKQLSNFFVVPMESLLDVLTQLKASEQDLKLIRKINNPALQQLLIHHPGHKKLQLTEEDVKEFNAESRESLSLLSLEHFQARLTKVGLIPDCIVQADLNRVCQQQKQAFTNPMVVAFLSAQVASKLLRVDIFKSQLQGRRYSLFSSSNDLTSAKNILNNMAENLPDQNKIKAQLENIGVSKTVSVGMAKGIYDFMSSLHTMIPKEEHVELRRFFEQRDQMLLAKDKSGVDSLIRIIYEERENPDSADFQKKAKESLESIFGSRRVLSTDVSALAQLHQEVMNQSETPHPQ